MHTLTTGVQEMKSCKRKLEFLHTFSTDFSETATFGPNSADSVQEQEFKCLFAHLLFCTFNVISSAITFFFLNKCLTA